MVTHALGAAPGLSKCVGKPTVKSHSTEHTTGEVSTGPFTCTAASAQTSTPAQSHLRAHVPAASCQNGTPPPFLPRAALGTLQALAKGRSALPGLRCLCVRRPKPRLCTSQALARGRSALPGIICLRMRTCIGPAAVCAHAHTRSQPPDSTLIPQPGTTLTHTDTWTYKNACACLRAPVVVLLQHAHARSQLPARALIPPRRAPAVRLLAALLRSHRLQLRSLFVHVRAPSACVRQPVHAHTFSCV